MKIYAIFINLIACFFIYVHIPEFSERIIGAIFLTMMQFCLLYEHGYKIFLKKGYKKIFMVFYCLPFAPTFIITTYFISSIQFK